MKNQVHITTSCAACGRPIRARVECLGRDLQCAHCTKVFRVTDRQNEISQVNRLLYEFRGKFKIPTSRIGTG